jgi:NodT family efflux transporter outer membrane factor (OMF) lipoprotein
MNRLLLPLAGMVAALAGCAVTDTPPPPPVEAPAAFRHAPELPVVAREPVRLPPADEWWRSFADPELDRLAQLVAERNEDIRAAAARVAQARAILAAQRSRLWPSVGASAGAARSDAGRNARPGTRYSLGADASWEVDLWGRLSRAVALGEEGLAASVADEAALRLSVQAMLVETYLQLRGVERRESLLDDSVRIAHRLLELSQVRYEAGVVDRADVLQAQTQLANVEAQRSELRIARAQLEHALALLSGLPPSEFAITPTATLPAAPSLPSLLPAQVLERRPDIAAARHRVVAAHAAIGLAESAHLPSLNLSASAGFAGSELGSLVGAPALAWSLGAALAQTLFDGGQRAAATDQARAEAEEAVAAYRGLVLRTLVEVEDNLVAVAQLHQQAALQEVALESARRTLDIVEAQYREGTVSFLNVATAQSQLQGAEIALSDARLRLLLATAGLLKNAGGRWEVPVGSR